MRGNFQRQPLEAVPDSVEHRLRQAFPEIDLKKIAEGSTIFNEHNLAEKWNATVRSIQFWVDLSQ